ncbi:murein biosynthesis integral membrane protein MurJ [Modestobacter sp. URMC 112]
MSPVGRAGPAAPDRDDGEEPAAGAARDSLRIAGWTLVSRVTGVLRVAAIGAVLGPTLLGNTFLFTNALPNLVYYGFLAGSLLSSLLVPALVGPMDSGDRLASERIAGAFLGVTVAAVGMAACAAVLAGPLLLRLGALGTQAEAVGAAQERVGRLLLLLLIPQVVLYALIGASTAVMNARRRFALAAAAPALENLGILAVLGATALLFPAVRDIGAVPGPLLVLLGAGTTAAVALHAGVQWWGARRAGTTLRPRAGWRDPAVTALVRRALPAIALAAVGALQLLTVLVLANRVAGGVVAVQLALNVHYFVIALGATPVALSLLPRLSRLSSAESFREVLGRGVALVLFVTVPAAAGCALLARPLAELLAVGRMGSAAAVALVATTVAALAAGTVGEGLFQVLSFASYARGDTRAPLRAMVVQAGTFLTLASSVLVVGPPRVPLVLGASFAVAHLVGAGHLALALRRELGTLGGQPSACLRRVLAATALMAAPVWAAATLVPRWVDGRAGSLLAAAAAATLGAAVFLLLQGWWRAPELAWVTRGTLGPRRRTATIGGAP